MSVTRLGGCGRRSCKRLRHRRASVGKGEGGGQSVSMQKGEWGGWGWSAYLSGLVLVDLVASLHLVEGDEPVEEFGTDLVAIGVTGDLVAPAPAVAAHEV